MPLIAEWSTDAQIRRVEATQLDHSARQGSRQGLSLRRSPMRSADSRRSVPTWPNCCREQLCRGALQTGRPDVPRGLFPQLVRFASIGVASTLAHALLFLAFRGSVWSSRSVSPSQVDH